jgi:hypothetical protein
MNDKLTPREAELLLGGHAAGTLTEAERSALFQAALDHQEVFDALMDEEALRELLADPAARAQLLAALAEPPKVLPFWRRHPGALGLAASLLIVVTAGVAYLRTPEARERSLEKAPPSTTTPPALKEAPAAPEAKPTPAPEEALARRVRKPTRSAEAPVADKAFGYFQGSAGAAPSPAGGAPTGEPPKPTAPPAEIFRDAEAASRAKAEVAKEKADQVGAVRSEERKAAPPAAAPSVHGPAAQNAYQNQVQNNVILQEVAPVAKKATGPTWSLEAGGKVLVVHHPSGHAVILLRRSARGPVQLRPRPPRSAEPGLTRFDLGTEPGPWDLYVLPKAPTEPLQLPEQGPFEGTRVRIPAADASAQ